MEIKCNLNSFGLILHMRWANVQFYLNIVNGTIYPHWAQLTPHWGQKTTVFFGKSYFENSILDPIKVIIFRDAVHPENDDFGWRHFCNALTLKKPWVKTGSTYLAVLLNPNVSSLWRVGKEYKSSDDKQINTLHSNKEKRPLKKKKSVKCLLLFVKRVFLFNNPRFFCTRSNWHFSLSTDIVCRSS